MSRIAKPHTCFKCEVGNLFWKKVPPSDAVRHANADGSIHYCKPEDVARVAARKLNQPYAPIAQTEQTEASEPIATPAPAPTTKPQVSVSEQDAGKVLADLVRPHFQADLDAAIELASEAAQKASQRFTEVAITVNRPDEAAIRIEGAHFQTPRLIRYLSLRLNVFLKGPAGSGKTYAAYDAAKALGLGDRYFPQSVGPQTSKSDLIGYMDATGKLVRTLLREAYEHGGVFLLDEIDAGNPGVLTVLNALLANDKVGFPDGVVSKHPDFYCIAAGNTFGNGPDAMYNGRQKLDAATVDRFVGIDWFYDRAIEAKLSGYTGIVPAQHETFASAFMPNLHFTELVWKLREAADELNVRAVFGTRRIMQGSALLTAGIPRNEVEAATVWFGLSSDDKAKLQAKLRGIR